MPYEKIRQRYIIIIWHQAGGRTDNKNYQVWWDDETDQAFVFDTQKAAANAWRNSGMNEIHAGTVINITAGKCDWV